MIPSNQELSTKTKWTFRKIKKQSGFAIIWCNCLSKHKLFKSVYCIHFQYSGHMGIQITKMWFFVWVGFFHFETVFIRSFIIFLTRDTSHSYVKGIFSSVVAKVLVWPLISREKEKKMRLSRTEPRYYAVENSSVVTSFCSFQCEVRGRMEIESSLIVYSLPIAPQWYFSIRDNDF